MTFGLFNFYVDGAGTAELISMTDSAALSKVCNVNNTIILVQRIIVFSLVATAHLQS
jgi:hypothetical protein